jgi:predicted DNA-binding transcriptional regulator YafY
MDSLEPKKLALIRIWQILKEYSDQEHPLTQEEIASHLEKDYGIVIERKAIGRNISLLKEAGIEIGSGRGGSYLACREFEDSELHFIIDGILGSKHINAKHSKDLIERICGLSNNFFKSHVKNIYSVNDLGKTDSQDLFYNIETIDSAIEQGKRVCYDYNKFGIDKKLHKTSFQVVSPYQMILHNQRYYLMSYSEYWGNMVFHRLDRITNIRLTDDKATPLRSIPGYKNGIDHKKLTSEMPYLYTDEPEVIEMTADEGIVDQIIDWFGRDIRISKNGMEGGKVKVVLKASPNAMEHWAVQYVNCVEVTAPKHLRERIKESLKRGAEKYR